MSELSDIAVQQLMPNLDITFEHATARILNGSRADPGAPPAPPPAPVDLTWYRMPDEARAKVTAELHRCFPPSGIPMNPAHQAVIADSLARNEAIRNDPRSPKGIRTPSGRVEDIPSGAFSPDELPFRGCSDGFSGHPATVMYFNAATGHPYDTEAVVTQRNTALMGGPKFPEAPRLDVPTANWWQFPFDRVRYRRDATVRVLGPGEPEPTEH